MTRTLRIALCDDHAVLRAGLKRLLVDEDDLDVVGEAGTADEAVSVAEATRPDVFVVDIGLPGESGLSAIRRLRRASPTTQVLVLTMYEDVAFLREAFEAGAVGYLVKRAADVELVLAVRAAAAGQRYVHPSMGAALVEPPDASPGGTAHPLSAREIDVLRLLTLGHTNSEIAEQLYLSVRTVETHRSHIQRKLGLRSRAELARYAKDHGLVV